MAWYKNDRSGQTASFFGPYHAEVYLMLTGGGIDESVTVLNNRLF